MSEPASAATTRTVDGAGRVMSVCSACGDSVDAPNTQFGCATVYAWELAHGRDCPELRR